MPFPRWLQHRNIQAALIMLLTLVVLAATESQIGLTWDGDIYMRASEIYTSKALYQRDLDETGKVLINQLIECEGGQP